MKQWLKNNSLGLVLIVLFLIMLLGQSITGFKQYNEDQEEHGGSEITYTEYFKEGHFIEATFENWESEFLQMAAYVLLTIHLRQKGSAESKILDGDMPVDQEPRKARDKDAPWPVRTGGLALSIYKHSLSLALILLFLISFFLHAYGGAQVACQENNEHGQQQCESTFSYMTTSKFWFESLQNWQSEFLAVFAIVMLSIFLREKGSPESKPVNAPHYLTGTE